MEQAPRFDHAGSSVPGHNASSMRGGHGDDKEGGNGDRHGARSQYRPARDQLTAAPGIIDTHCHLNLLDAEGLLQPALVSIRTANLAAVVSVGLNLNDSRANAMIASAVPRCYFSVGWHPEEPDSPSADEMQQLEDLLRKPLAVAVGEIGLDFFFRPGYHEVPASVQEKSFQSMLDLAQRYRKPVLIHDRLAHERILEILADFPGVTGVMHCFSGDTQHLARVLDRGFMVSFSGIVTFRNSYELQEVARRVPSDMFVLETDSPFLAPVPHRGKRNLPGYIAETAACVAWCRGIQVAEVVAASSQNARALLGLAALPDMEAG